MKWYANPEEDVVNSLYHGQIVIIAARWLLILGGWILALWQPELPAASEVWKLVVQVAVLFTLSIGNFYLTVNYLRGDKSLPAVVFAASAGDLAVITILIMALGGFSTSLYVFYFPALLAISVAFPTRVVLGYAGAAIAVYGIIALSSVPGELVTAVEGQQILLRLMLMASITYCGIRYRRLEAEKEGRAAPPIGTTRHPAEDAEPASAPIGLS